MRIRSVLATIILMAVPVLGFAAIIPAAPKLAAKSWVLMDAESGYVLTSSDADLQVEPASLTKMMTSYILSWDLAQGRVKNEDMVLVSQNAWAQNFPGSSLMWIEVGKEVSLDDLHRGIIISSGNDASVAVAEHLAGSEGAFADMMNQHAQRLGMTATHFVNAHGLPDPDHYTTATDMAILARAIIKDFPEDYKLYAEKYFVYNNIRQPNRNRLLWRDSSVDGLKTGHTESAGYCLVASAKRKGMRLISVVMGTDGEETRARETQSLLTWGFRFFESFRLYETGESLSTLEVWGGKTDSVELGTGSEVHLTIPRGQRSNIKASVQVDGVIHAPIKSGDVIGRLQIHLNDELLKEEPLVALGDVEQAGFLGRSWDSLRLFFRNLLKRS
ncbi:MAG: D-alanyl-D-alanine carboxypeptidase [Gammaproteobacteria bacterium]|nr:MAG: D-alanyl-D-alanine carboxypeptidase [Gammaproteobacteria bacterium]